MNLIKLLKNTTVSLIRLDATASINSLYQQLKKLFGILNATTGKLAASLSLSLSLSISL